MNGVDGMDGKVALVTGGSRGIGLAAARGLAQLGATVVLVGRTTESATRAADLLLSDGLDVVPIACDVSNADDVARMAQDLGPLAAVDVLVCAAGVMSSPASRTIRSDPAEWSQVMATNLDGVFHVVHAFVPGMVERRSGRVVTVSACLGRFSGPGTAGGLAPYRISKAAVNALTKNLAAEVSSRGVLADAMCPGHCRTDMGGENAPRSAEEGADTIVWLATRETEGAQTGLLWEDRLVVPW
jgi:NAD(P)-dependent dehydrogenase (short-subunit alcohol dehydrogenase family)